MDTSARADQYRSKLPGRRHHEQVGRRGTKHEAMTGRMGQLIKDIDKLVGYKGTMMEEMRDITLFYDRLYPELHCRATRKRDDDDKRTP